MIKVQMFIGAALLVGVAIGYFAGGRGGVGAEAIASDGYVAKKAVADEGESASVKALRHRIAELERMLAEKDARSEVAISNAVAEAVKDAPPRDRRRGNPGEWLENLKKNDPARYTQMTNRFAQWRSRRAEQVRNKMDFLSSIDTSHMSAGAKQTHDDLQALLAKREEIEAQIHQEGVTDDERRQLMGELHATNDELRKLNGQERKNLLTEMSRNMGFEGDDAEEISATVQDILQATDNFGGFRPPRGDRGPRGAPGGR